MFFLMSAIWDSTFLDAIYLSVFLFPILSAAASEYESEGRPSPPPVNLTITPGSWTHLYILVLDNKPTSAELTSALPELIE